MHLPIQLCGLLLYAFVSTVSSQERVWHTTTPGPVALSGVPSVEAGPVAAEPAGDAGPVVPQEDVAAAEPAVPAAQSDDDRDLPDAQDVLTEQPKEPLVAVEGRREEEKRKEKKERKFLSAKEEKAKEEEKVRKEEENSKKEEKKKDDKVAVAEKETKEGKATIEEKTKEEPKESRRWMSAPKEEVVEAKKENTESEQTTAPEVVEESEHSAEVSSEEKSKKKKKPRKWMSVPGMAIEEEITARPPEDLVAAQESLDLAQQAVVEEPVVASESVVEPFMDPYSINALDMGLPENITELLEAAEEGIPLVQEIIVSKKTTVYVTISDSVDAEPLFVNLTGIRYFTGQERRMMAGCLDLSDLMLTGEEAKEVIQRMSKHKFHKLDLSNNNITEFPANTFSPVAFTVRELRLDGNPLASNDQGEASVLQRGGLFHLTELRELNLSSCGLKDMDYFTPWNSNHLEVVDLSNNKLSTVPANLQFFHKIKKLYIDGNPITRITELPFALLWNMQVLSIADCEVAAIEDDPFRNMDKLKELSLEGNNLTQIGHVRLPKSNSAVKMFLSGNPWHCACEMLNFIEHYHYAVRDIEYIRCASPRWLEGLRTAYLTKEILSLDSIDGDCTPQSPRVSAPLHLPTPVYPPTLRTDRLQLLALIVFVLAALFMLCHVLWARKKDKYRFDDDRDDIHYIRIEKKPNFK